MEVGFWGELFSAVGNTASKAVSSGAVSTAASAAADSTKQSITDALIKNGVDVINAYGNYKIAKQNAKAQKYGGGAGDFYGGGGGRGRATGYDDGGDVTGLLGKNAPMILGGIAAVGVVLVVAKMMKKGGRK